MKDLDWNRVLEAGGGDVRRLSFVTRYSSIPVSFSENVAEHQYWVALYAAIIHRAVMPDDEALVGAILTKAVIHDLAESVTGDVVRTFKYSSTRLKEAIDDAEEKIVEGFHPGIVDLYGMYDGMAKTEADRLYVEAVVKAADFMSLQQYMNREWLRGNREFEPFFDRMIDDLDSVGRKTQSSEEPRVKAISGLYFAMARQARSGKRYTA